jgi:hypothetical protein
VPGWDESGNMVKYEVGDIISASGGADHTINGAIAASQIIYGFDADEIQSSANFTYDGTDGTLTNGKFRVSGPSLSPAFEYNSTNSAGVAFRIREGDVNRARFDYAFGNNQAYIGVVDAGGTDVLDAFVIESETNNNYVGINTDNPSAQLDVVGNAEVNGDLTVTGTCTGCGGATNLDGLSDVAITSSATGDLLRYNGTNYVDVATIDGSNITDGGIAAVDIASNSITAAQIATNGVGNLEISSSAVDTEELADNSVTGAKIANNAVGASAILANAVGSSEMSDNAVGLAEINPAGGVAGEILVLDSSGDPDWQAAGGTDTGIPIYGAWSNISFETNWGNFTGYTAKWRSVTIDGEQWIQFNGARIERTGGGDVTTDVAF